MTHSHLEPVQFGRYLLLDKLAVGGMAEIFRAKTSGAHGFEKTVVVKRILPQLVGDLAGGFLERFISEARLMMQLNHPKVVQVLDFGEVDGQYFIAMEYIDGIDGSALLRSCAHLRRRPSSGIAVHIAAEVLDALDYAHSLHDAQGVHLGITHRDVSPSNIFISVLGQVKLGDFGIAKVEAWKEYTEPGALKGKYGYLSPEAVSGMQVDHRSDVFSVGVVLAEMLMIRRLFIADNPLDVLLQVRDVNLERLDRYGGHIDPRLREIVDAALARDPTLRFQDAATFRDALHRYLFDRQFMVRENELRRFLQRLREAEVALGGADSFECQPTADVSPRHAPMRPDPGQDVLQVVASNPPTSTGPTLDLRRNQQPEEEPRRVTYRRRRKQTLRPPSKPEPVPTGTRETPQIKTHEALAAVTEIEEGSASAGFSGDPPRVELPSEIPPFSQPSLKEVAASRVSIVDSAPLTRPEISGELSVNSAARVFFRLALGEEQGLLVLRKGTTVKEIYLEDGDPEYVASNLPDELFGQYLLKKGVLSDGELSMALAMLPHFSGKLGTVLVALKLLKPMEVMRHLTHQVRHKLLDVFGWEQGSYAFYRNRVFEQDAAPLGLDGFEIVGAGIFAMVPAVLWRRLEPLLKAKLRSISPPSVPLEAFRLGRLPREVYDRLDGRFTTGQLLDRYDDQEQRLAFAQAIHLLAETGLAAP